MKDALTIFHENNFIEIVIISCQESMLLQNMIIWNLTKFKFLKDNYGRV